MTKRILLIVLGLLSQACTSNGGLNMTERNPNGEQHNSIESVTDGASRWTRGGPVSGGSVTALVIDPLNPDTLYAVGGKGGVFKSTDGGAHWQAVNTGFGANTQVQVLAIDPLNPGTIYAGGGLGELYKSTDGSAHWRAANTGLSANTQVRVLAIDPVNSGTIYAGTLYGGIYKSTDGGVQWRAANTGLGNVSVRSIAIDPRNPGTVYAGGGGSSKFYKSTDGGAHWQALSEGLGNLIVVDVGPIAIDPRNPGTVYGGVVRGFVDGSVGAPAARVVVQGTIFKSTDSGAHWQVVDSGLGNAFIKTLAIDPLNPATVFAGAGDVPPGESSVRGGGVYKSTDGGAHWQAMNTGLPANAPVQSIAIDPQNPTTVFAVVAVAGSWVLYKSTDGGAQWQGVNAELYNVAVGPLVIDPRNPATVYAGSDHGVFKSSDGGAHWQAVNSGLNNLIIRALAIDPSNPATLYVGTGAIPMVLPTYVGSGVYKSTDGGAHWHDVTAELRKAVFAATRLDMVREGVRIRREGDGAVIEGASVFTDTRSGESRTEYTELIKLGPEVRGMTDQEILEHYYLQRSHPGDSGAMTQILSLAVNPSNPATIYAVVEGGSVYKSTDGGAHWQAANAGLVGNASLWCSALAIDPRNPATVYTVMAGVEGGGATVKSTVYKSTDGGAHWHAVDSGLGNAFVQTLAIDPLNPATLYAGAGGVPGDSSVRDGGVYKSTDGGAHWQVMNTGLPANAQAQSIAIEPRSPATVYAVAGVSGTDKSTVYKSTDGGGHWQAVNARLDSDTRVLTLAIDPVNPATVYAGTTDGVFKITFAASSPP